MPKPHKDWKVLPHGPLERLGDNLYVVTGELKMPLGETTRRMTVAVLRGKRLAIYSAIALREETMAELEALGTPEFLIVPSAIHRIDIAPWKERYPGIEVIAPEGAKQKVGEIVPVDATTVALGDPRVKVDAVPGTNRRELAMVVESKTGKTLVVNDLIFNFPKMGGVMGWVMKVLGFGPGHPTIPKLVKKKLVADDAAMKRQLRAWADLDLARIVPAHGGIIENARETLLELATG